MALGLMALPSCAWAANPGAAKIAGVQSGSPRASAVSTQAGCMDGWRRVGTLKDRTLGKSWAVVVNCKHPAWPARLEPATHWKALPMWVPAGSRVTLISPGGVTAMRLEGRTVTPGRVGESVGVRLIDRALVEARLVAPGTAEIETVARWGEQ